MDKINESIKINYENQGVMLDLKIDEINKKLSGLYPQPNQFCPTCKTGQLLLRNYGGKSFLGCSNYKEHNCKTYKYEA